MMLGCFVFAPLPTCIGAVVVNEPRIRQRKLMAGCS